MPAWGEIIPDLTLAVLFTYMLARLATSSDSTFKTPFYVLFITTGIYSVISVISFIIFSQFFFTEHYWTVYVYKIAYACNVFGACGATLGKAFIAIHRYFVMRTQDFSEKARHFVGWSLSKDTHQGWSGKVLQRFLLAQFVISVVRTAPVWPASYRYQDDEIVALSKDYTLILKAFTVSSYVLYIVCNGICTALTCRELIKLRRSHKGESTMRLIMITQRNLFIVVTVCSVSYLIKALHQFAIAVSTFFNLQELYDVLYPTYPIVNGFATYAAPVCLVLCSPIVRARIFTFNQCSRKGSSISAYTR